LEEEPSQRRHQALAGSFVESRKKKSPPECDEARKLGAQSAGRIAILKMIPQNHL